MILELRKLSKTYPGAAQPALNEVSISVPAGQFLVILGPSGAGKSSLMRCVNRLVEPSSGEVVFQKTPITNSDLRAVRRQFGMVFQQFNLVKRLSVLTNVLTGRLGYRSVLRSLFYSFPE